MQWKNKFRRLKHEFLTAVGARDEGTFDIHGQRLVNAAEMNKFYSVQSLLEDWEVPVDSKDRDGYTAMHKACHRGLEIVADTIRPFEPDTSIQTVDGYTCWHMAAICSLGGEPQTKIIQKFSPSAEVLDLKNTEGKTMLHIAASAGSAAFIDAAIELGADPTIKDNDGNTPLDIAREKDRDDGIIAKFEKAMEAKAAAQAVTATKHARSPAIKR